MQWPTWPSLVCLIIHHSSKPGILFLIDSGAELQGAGLCALFWQVKSGKSQGSSQVPENPPVDSPLFWFWNPAFTALFSLRGQDTLPNLSLLLAPTRITGSPLKSLSPRLPDSPLSQPSQLCSGHSLWTCWHHGGHRSRWSCWTVSLCPADRPVALQVGLPWSVTS